MSNWRTRLFLKWTLNSSAELTAEVHQHGLHNFLLHPEFGLCDDSCRFFSLPLWIPPSLPVLLRFLHNKLFYLIYIKV